MPIFVRFLLEQSVLNSAAILIGIAAGVLLFGSLLSKRRAGPWLRSGVYAAAGAVGGVWSYIGFDGDLATLHVTAPLLAIGFFVASLLIVFPFVYFGSKRQRTET